MSHLPRRVGLFGGTFDPVHCAHVALADTAQEELALDEVRWLPAGQPWQKARVATPAFHREAMVALAIADDPHFMLDRRELTRIGPSYTLDTVRELQAEARDAVEWVLILGEDQYVSLHTWHGWQELLQRVTLAVARRSGVRRTADAAVLAASQRAVSLPMMDISSTEVRRRCAAGESIAELVPSQVARYIDHHRLYRDATGS